MDRIWPGELSVPRLVDVRTNLGDHWSSRGHPGIGETVHTGRTVHPGDRIVFTCTGHDPHGRQLLWWLHPVGQPRSQPVFGTATKLTWQIDRHAIGDRAYAGIGMVGDSLRHRGRGDQGYDGWVLFYYRVTDNTSINNGSGR